MASHSCHLLRHRRPQGLRGRNGSFSSPYPELERLNTLPWNSALPQNDDDDTPFPSSLAPMNSKEVFFHLRRLMRPSMV